ncbi:phosphatidylinositol-3-phosphatase SAC1-like [Macrobrachium nipponense]|uniref:phosphatidylinositol-3-phosphatase SAC1-like n=1 Tax=Macrobrachium nipponense TaxID=159736 RepID=UPI0030C8CF08
MECGCRQTRSSGSDPRHRVVPSSSGSRQTFPGLGEIHAGPFCYLVEQETGDILFSGSRSFSVSGGRIPTSLGQPGGVYLPSFLFDPSSSEQAGEFTGSQDDFGSPSVASGGMVSRSTVIVVGDSEGNSPLAASPVSVTCRKVPPVSRIPVSSWLETIKYLLRVRGFSQRTAGHMSSSLRKLTSVVYQGQYATETAFAFGKHFEEEISFHNHVYCISLVEQSGKEKVIADAYLNNILTFDSENLTFVTFDFHEYCRGMRYEHVSFLIEGLEDIISKMLYCWVDKEGTICRQNGIFRVNCIDCLDRTNVVQTAIAKSVLENQFVKLGMIPPEHPLPPACRSILQIMWANNGDTISKQYAGTSALKVGSECFVFFVYNFCIPNIVSLDTRDLIFLLFCSCNVQEF